MRFIGRQALRLIAAVMAVSAPTASCGGMIAEGKDSLAAAAHVSLAPVSVLFLTVSPCNLLGDTLRNLNDPKESRL